MLEVLHELVDVVASLKGITSQRQAELHQLVDAAGAKAPSPASAPAPAGPKAETKAPEPKSGPKPAPAPEFKAADVPAGA